MFSPGPRARFVTASIIVIGVVATMLTLRGPTAKADESTTGPNSVDTSAGDRLGRQALGDYTRRLSSAPSIDPELDGVAREQLRIAIAGSAETGSLGPRLLHPYADVLVRVGLISTPDLDTRADVFALGGPETASAVGSAGGQAVLPQPGSDMQSTFVGEVAAVAWRDAGLAETAGELTALYGAVPQTQEQLDEAAAQRWLDQENRDRQSNGFPNELLARRHAVLDREAENTLRRRFGEPTLPAVVDPSGEVALDKKVHFTAYDCSPNCEQFWSVPDRFVEVLRQSSLEDLAAESAQRPELFDFRRYNSRLTWAVQLPRLAHYWNSYRMFGVATRVRLDQEVVEGRDAARAAVEAIAPGAADVWDPHAYKMDIVVIAYDPWPTDWHHTS